MDTFCRILSILISICMGYSQAEVQTRNPRLFLVTTSSVSTTVNSGTVCYSTATSGFTGTCNRRRRAIVNDILEDNTDVQIDIAASKSEIESVDGAVKSGVADEGEREARFISGLLYWITTTTTSTSIAYTKTTT